jgi:protein-disulfide isomerase
VLFGGVVLLIGVAVWFTALQVFVIKSLCPFCLAIHLCGVLAASLVFLIQRAAIRGTNGLRSSSGAKTLSVTAALTSLGLLMAGQVVHTPRTGMVKSIPGTGAATPVLATQAVVQPAPAAALTPASESPSIPQPQVQSAAALPSRLFPIYSGRFMLDLEAVPVLGAPTNAQVIVSLFDYTCHHCRLMHPLLVEAQRTFSNELVIASLPMPLDPQCNQTVKVTTPDHSNACEYARLGLAVWRADRSKHREFDDWMFAAERPPSAAEARDYATQLVGASRLAVAREAPWVEQQLKLDVLLYELAYRFGQGSMPQLIVGSNVAVGTFPRGELLQLLEKNLGLKKF